jgi:phosphinothricin acetyltransferase
MRDVTVRPAVVRDVPELTDIYNYYVLMSPATFDVEPITVEARREWFSHYAADGPHRLFVATRDDKVVGFASSSRLAARQAYSRSIETSVYVHVGACGQGVGKHLYGALFAALVGGNVHRAYAQVTLPNPASVALHRRFGFHEISLQNEVGHKFGVYWSVLLFEKHLN